VKQQSLLFLALLLSATAALFSIRAVGSSVSAGASPTGLPLAFQNASWGMSPQEVEHANRAVLAPAVESQRFFRKADDDPSHYLFYEQRDLKFLGRAANITYTFRNNHLFTYHVFVSDTDADRLDEDVRRYLTRLLGTKFSEPEDETALKLVWQFKNRIVNYWLVEEDISLRPKYTAVVGVTVR
jgi:hypothetical protein